LSADHPGTSIMHGERFPLGRAKFVAVDYLPPGEVPDAAYPFLLITGRILQHYGCGAQSRRTDILRCVDADVLEMHPRDAAGLRIAEGEFVRMVSARGESILSVTISERVQSGQVFTSFHFPSTGVNVLLSSSADESSKCPEYKVSAVRIERLTEAESAAHAGGPARARLVV
jgi:formate dehydrogenase major subunit